MGVIWFGRWAGERKERQETSAPCVFASARCSHDRGSFDKTGLEISNDDDEGEPSSSLRRTWFKGSPVKKQTSFVQVQKAILLICAFPTPFFMLWSTNFAIPLASCLSTR